MKMRAVMRYKRLPFDWVQITPDIRKQLKHDGPPVIPILQLPEDGSLHVDSTPLCYLLEQREPERSLFPPDPELAFLCELIEDMADEWCTKIMFHYRWYRDIDREYSSHWIIRDTTPGIRGPALDVPAKAITDRQVSRMALVGCTEQNAPIIEQSYHELLAILDSFVARDEFLFGTRPSLADFGLFGQLKTLASDHTPMLIMRAKAPAVHDWVRRLDDLSGVEGKWHDVENLRPEVIELLAFSAKYYLPFLQTNRNAYVAGDAELHAMLDGQEYAQAPFKYQVKCYDRLCKLFANLPPEASEQATEQLEAAGCLQFLE